MEYNIKAACLIVAQDSDFNPQFTEVGSLEECADFINRPHEDYPHYIAPTAAGIELMIEHLRANESSYRGWTGVGINSFLIRQLHEFVFQDTTHAGSYRPYDTYPKGGRMNAYLPHFMVSSTLETIVPLNFANLHDNVEQGLEDMTLWYKAFEIIHPFLDGNGRVGGILVAANLYYRYGKWFAPLQ